jgi:hypothetical protein
MEAVTSSGTAVVTLPTDPQILITRVSRKTLPVNLPPADTYRS